jgi:hypothetical protein
MKYSIASFVLLIVIFGAVYMITNKSPRPSQNEIEFALTNTLKYNPIKWDFKFGKETKASNGVPAWPVTYEITTSEGTEKKIVTLTLLFYKEGYDWKTEKVE